MASGAELRALSWQSDGPLGSGWRGPKASADAEVLVAMRPEMLLLGPGETVREEMLPGTQVVSLNWVEDVEGIRGNLDLVPGLVPGPLSITHNLERPRDEPGDKSVLYLSRAGGTAGPGTYVDEAIRLAGGINLVDQPGWFTPDPEWIVAQNPDVVLTSFFDAYESVNAPTVRNRAVRKWMAGRERIDVPGKLWPCAGPGLGEAVQLIADGLE